MNLYVDIGAPGSGKSTHAKRFIEMRARQFEPEHIVRLNADELRAFYGKGEEDQSVSFQAFQFISFAAEMLFRQGFSVLIDVTSKDKRARAEFISIAKKYGANTVAFLFNTPLDICLERNANRSRVVPPDIVTRIFNQIRDPLPGEFDEIRIVDYKVFCP